MLLNEPFSTTELLLVSPNSVNSLEFMSYEYNPIIARLMNLKDILMSNSLVGSLAFPLELAKT